MGPVLMTGPMSRLMVNVLNNASMFDGLNALEACLHSIGVPGDKILELRGRGASRRNSGLNPRNVTGSRKGPRNRRQCIDYV